MAAAKKRCHSQNAVPSPKTVPQSCGVAGVFKEPVAAAQSRGQRYHSAYELKGNFNDR
jgi:hypothetical protein